jgi:hypothetical protein
MATRYWVGGAGTWDTTSTANWSTTTGGASGASAPTSADIATFDANSGSGYTVTLSENISLSSFTANQAVNLTLNFVNYKMSIAGAGGIVFRSSVIEYLGTPVVELTYSGSVGTRTINPGAATVVTNPPTFNIIAGTDIVGLTYTSGLKYNTVNFTGFSGTWILGASSNLNILGDLILSSGMSVGSGAGLLIFSKPSGVQKITTAGKAIDCPITVGAVGTTNTVQLQDNLTMGSTRIYTLTAGTLDLNNLVLSTGLFASNNSNIRTIDFKSGKLLLTAGNTGSTVLNMNNMTGFTYAGTSNIELNYSGATGTRVINMGVTAGVESNSLNISVSAGTDIVTIVNGSTFKNLNFTGFAGSLSINSRVIYGNLTISSGMTVTAGTSATTFASTSGTQQITTNNVTLDFPLTFNGIGGTFAFQDALTQGSTRAFTVTNGTVQLKNGVTSTVGAFATSGTNQKFLQSTTPGSTATLSQASGTVNASYLTIQDITATGGAVWFAPVSQLNVDVSNNDGWDFFIQLGQYMYTRRKNKRLLIS